MPRYDDICRLHDRLLAEAIARVPFGDLTDRDRSILRQRTAERAAVPVSEVTAALQHRARTAARHV